MRSGLAHVLVAAALLTPQLAASDERPARLAGQIASSSRPPDADSSPIEFWTIAPNEGQSAGGHSAIRVGESIHHFEHRGDGLIQARRDDRADFERAYRGRGNRGIDVLRLDLPPDVITRLTSLLRDRTLDSALRFDRLESIDEDLRWLDRAIERGAPAVVVPGLGLLDRRNRPRVLCDEAELSRAATPRWRARIASTLQRAITRARRDRATALSRLTHLGNDAETRSRAARRLVESAQLVESLAALQNCSAIAAHALIPLSPADSKRPLDRIRWLEIRGQLEADLVRLVSSARPDRGLAILLTWGRLRAVDESLARNTLVVLDAFAERDAEEGASDRATLPPDWSEARRIESLAARDQALSSLVQASPESLVEPLLDRLERRHHDLRHARRAEPHSARVPVGALKATIAMERSASEVSLAWPEGVTLDALRTLKAHLERARFHHLATLQHEFRYALATRNCVTELLVILDDAMEASPTTAAFTERRKRDREAALAFVPVAAHRIVARNAPILSRVHLPGVRENALERARAETGARRAGSPLREWSPLSSAFYEPHPSDSTFLLFTDRTIWTRPVGGLVNLVAATSLGAIGVLTSPFDGGRALRDGAQGFMMSIPELFFFNIRKGSYPVTPPASLLREP